MGAREGIIPHGLVIDRDFSRLNVSHEQKQCGCRLIATVCWISTITDRPVCREYANVDIRWAVDRMSRPRQWSSIVLTGDNVS